VIKRFAQLYGQHFLGHGRIFRQLQRPDQLTAEAVVHVARQALAFFKHRLPPSGLGLQRENRIKFQLALRQAL